MIQDIHEMSTGNESLNETKGHWGGGGPYRSWGLKACHWVMLLLLMVQKSCVKKQLREWTFLPIINEVYLHPRWLAGFLPSTVLKLGSSAVEHLEFAYVYNPAAQNTCEQPTSPITEYNISEHVFLNILAINSKRSKHNFLPQRRSNWKPF